jgi:hypothetical protein
VEISFDIETEFIVEFSFSWFSLPFISIDDVPLLVDISILIGYLNVSVFRIEISLNFDNLSSLVDNESILISEELPPS